MIVLFSAAAASAASVVSRTAARSRVSAAAACHALLPHRSVPQRPSYFGALYGQNVLHKPLGGSFVGALGAVRNFGVKRVTQRRRTRGRLIQLKQTHYEPKPDGYAPLPLSLLASGAVRRVMMTNTVEAQRLAGQVDWDRYKCDVKGVRWHPVGGWRVQFDRRNYQHNFFVKCSCYFRVGQYGFEGARELAIGYRKRLEAEWEEQEQQWERLDDQRAMETQRRREEKRIALSSASYADTGALWGLGTDEQYRES